MARLTERQGTAGPAQEVARPQQVGTEALVRKLSGWVDEFGKALPSHISARAWLATVVAALRRDPKLWAAAEAGFDELMVALFRAAQMGLEPGTEEYYLTIRKGKIMGIPGYQGEIERIYRAGAVSSVTLELVHQNDYFVWRPGEMDRPAHRPDWFADRGPLIGVYAYAVMKDGTPSKVVLLNRVQVEKIRKASDGADSSYSPWNNWEESMWLKSAAHQLRKWVPTSSEFMAGQARASAGAQQDVRGVAAIPQEFARAALEFDPEENIALGAPSTPARGIAARPQPQVDSGGFPLDLDPSLEQTPGGGSGD